MTKNRQEKRYMRKKTLKPFILIFLLKVVFSI